LSLPVNVTKVDILAGFRTLGLAPGMAVVVHSSLRSFGYVQGGALGVIEALIEAVAPEGTVLIPTFNHGLIVEDGWEGFYDPIETPTVNGIIPETFRKLPGVKRSLNPTHPVAAWGRRATGYVSNHHRTLTMGPASPLGLLHQDGGYGLLLGVDFGSNTFHHIVELSCNAPCTGRRTEEYRIRLPDGRWVMGRSWGWRAGPCPITDEGRYPAEMFRRGMVAEARIGSCRALFFHLADCFTVVAEMLTNGVDGFPSCRDCPVCPRVVPQTVESDWDEANQSLQPDSKAWEY